jgi:threonylcarbamoyladenosine tRNA methylthiotransferase MtaB
MNDPTFNKRFAVVTLGCRVNQCESDSLSQQLKDGGWTEAGSGAPAELVVVNTCAVTGKAAMQSRQAVRRACRDHPGARVVVTGCYAQIAADEIRKIEGVDTVCGNPEKHRIASLIRAGETVRISDVGRRHRFDPIRVPVETDRTRPVLKIQDGCNAFCTYCIVPYARGRSRSMPEADVLTHIRRLEAAGFCEVVLSGIHLGAYGADLDPATSLQRLLERIETETVIDRVRLSSIEPGELTPAIRRLAAASTRICPHFHVPLQSGDDDILRKMGRPYTSSQFEDLVVDLRRLLPDAAIGADVLVGFPGESEASFARTFALIERLPLTYLHVFPYSARPGTPAFYFSGQVSSAEIQQRCRILRRLGSQKRARFTERLVNRRVSALVEARRDPKRGWLKATTANYATVLLEGPDALKNRIVSCIIQRRVDDQSVFAEITDPTAASAKKRQSANRKEAAIP